MMLKNPVAVSLCCYTEAGKQEKGYHRQYLNAALIGSASAAINREKLEFDPYRTYIFSLINVKLCIIDVLKEIIKFANFGLDCM
jgi:hypothetical protein